MRIKYFFIFIVCLALMQTNSIPVTTSQPNLQINNSDKNKQTLPEKLYAAEIHYSRIPHQYWQHRLQMVKAMGFNALSVYIMWNFHQTEKGKFDYQNGDRNLVGFLELAKDLGFKVLFRPGPYVCAEWDFGGFPARLLSIKDLQIRANNKPYLDQVRVYFASLVPIMKTYSYTNSGPIIMLQIENQYGFFGNDKSYIQALRDMWRQLTIEDIPEYYVDWIQNIQKCHWEGANIGINDATKEEVWTKARQIQPQGYLLGGEIYSGWLTHWGEKWQGKSNEAFNKQFDFLMSNNHSFSMYMAHGGTNFGLTAGANGFDKGAFDYGGHVTSYDYDAPINEQGAPTSKYQSFRQMAKQHATWQIPQIPASIKTISINPFIPGKFADILANLPQATLKSVKQLVLFQDERLKMWNQGFVGYGTKMARGTFEINITVHDFALIFLNGELVQTLDRGEKTDHTIILQCNDWINNVFILVESMGHINFGAPMIKDYKGITNFNVKFTPPMSQKQQTPKQMSQTEFQWNIYTIPIDNNMLNWKNRGDITGSPRLFRYNLTLSEAGDTYLNMQNWQKGYLFVNGYNLGRYWNKGPQQKLFVPGVWLNKGGNDIVVLELLMPNARFIRGDRTLLVGKDDVIDKKQKYSQLEVMNSHVTQLP